MKASPGCLNILTYWRKYWVDRLRRILRSKIYTIIFYQQICRLRHYILHQVAHIDCSAPSGKQHEPLTGVCVIVTHYCDVIMGSVPSQFTSLTIVYSTVYSDADQRKHQSSASLAFVRGFHRGPVNSLHKWPVTRKMFPFDDVIMYCYYYYVWWVSPWHHATKLRADSRFAPSQWKSALLSKKVSHGLGASLESALTISSQMTPS